MEDPLVWIVACFPWITAYNQRTIIAKKGKLIHKKHGLYKGQSFPIIIQNFSRRSKLMNYFFKLIFKKKKKECFFY